MSSLFTESSRQGALWVGLRAQGFAIEEATINAMLFIRITNSNGGVWLSGKKMSYPMNSPGVHEIANDKRLSYEVANAIGINTPASLYVDKSVSIEEISNFMSRYKKVVVKPLDGYKSRGVTLNIVDEDELGRALQCAYQESNTAIIQEQVEAEEYRFSVLNHKVVSVLRRERPQIVGDGISTIAQLVEKENHARQQLPPTVASYPLWTEDLMGEIVLSTKVLDLGERCILSNTTLVSKGASVYELIEKTHQSYCEIAERFVKTIDAGYVAVDIFISDHNQQAEETNYWFNECNASPSLKLFTTSRNYNDEHIIQDVISTTAKHLNII